MLQEQAASGLSVRAFCRQRQLAEHRFYRWRRLVGCHATAARSVATPTRGAAFAEVVTPAAPGGTVAAGVTVQVDERVSIRLDRDFDPATFLAVMALLAGTRPCSH